VVLSVDISRKGKKSKRTLKKGDDDDSGDAVVVQRESKEADATKVSTPPALRASVEALRKVSM
jgi:hypothetical protein